MMHNTYIDLLQYNHPYILERWSKPNYLLTIVKYVNRKPILILRPNIQQQPSVLVLNTGKEFIIGSLAIAFLPAKTNSSRTLGAHSVRMNLHTCFWRVNKAKLVLI